MLPNKPPYFYKCNSCGKIFNSKIKVNPILEIFNIRKIINPFLKCPNCGSKDIKIALINNLINKNILVKRFMKNPEIEGIKILLQERMPEKAIITKEKKELTKKIEKVEVSNQFSLEKFDIRNKGAILDIKTTTKVKKVIEKKDNFIHDNNLTIEIIEAEKNGI